MTFHLFVCALAGAGAAVIAMVRHIFFLCMQKHCDLKLKREKKPDFAFMQCINI